MVGANASRWDAIERWSATLFLVAGGVLVVHAITHGLEAFAGIEYPWHHEFPFGVAGMFLGFVALLGLYPKTAGRMPKLARAGAVVAVLGAAGWLVMGVAVLAEELGTEPPAWIDAVGLVMIFGVVLGYLAFGVAGLRTDIVSQTTGLVLLTPVVVMVVNLGIATAGYGSLAGQFVVATGFAVAHLAIGTTLRTEDPFAGRAETAPGATT